MNQLKLLVQNLFDTGADFGFLIIKALLVFVVGRLIIKFINKFVKRLLEREKIDQSVKTFICSLVNILLIVLLGISIIGMLGIQTTSFAALIASLGVGIGMALSGNLSNFAGGIIILLFKPFKIGDSISTSSIAGTVQEIQIFHTILKTADGIKVFIPNGTLSSGYINNLNVEIRRLEWVIGVDYGVDFTFVKQTISNLLNEDKRILSNPEPLIELAQLADSSVNVVIRAWVEKNDYTDVMYTLNRNIYTKFNEVGISFPYPQLTIHKGGASDE